MSNEAQAPSGRRQENVRVSPSQVVRPRDRRLVEPEVRLDEDYVYVTLHAPEIQDEELRYSIRKRYVLVWGDEARHEPHYLVMLPVAVNPESHTVRFQNGVFDALIRIRDAR